MIAAIKDKFPSTNHQGCWFHYCQAIYKEISNLGLLTTYKMKKKVYLFCRYLMCLALLPPQKIIQSFNEICQTAAKELSENDFTCFNQLKSYFESFWIKTIGPNRFSVYNNYLRTNNGQESINGRLKNRIGVHQNFVKFYDNLIAVTKTFEAEIFRIGRGKRINRPIKTTSISKSQLINNASRKLAINSISLQEFLDLCVNNINQYINHDFHDFDIDLSADNLIVFDQVISNKIFD